MSPPLGHGGHNVHTEYTHHHRSQNVYNHLQICHLMAARERWEWEREAQKKSISKQICRAYTRTRIVHTRDIACNIRLKEWKEEEEQDDDDETNCLSLSMGVRFSPCVCVQCNKLRKNP